MGYEGIVTSNYGKELLGGDPATDLRQTQWGTDVTIDLDSFQDAEWVPLDGTHATAVHSADFPRITVTPTYPELIRAVPVVVGPGGGSAVMEMLVIGDTPASSPEIWSRVEDTGLPSNMWTYEAGSAALPDWRWCEPGVAYEFTLSVMRTDDVNATGEWLLDLLGMTIWRRKLLA